MIFTTFTGSISIPMNTRGFKFGCGDKPNASRRRGGGEAREMD